MASFLPAVLRGGVDVVQLREKQRPDAERLEMARIMVPICHEFDVPFVMNDSPELALESGADGVHVGQDDVSVSHCRDVLGDEAIVGLSTHSPDEFDAALSERASYLSAGPIVATPTKPGRTGTGLDYAVTCQARSDRPVFVTGGWTRPTSPVWWPRGCATSLWCARSARPLHPSARRASCATRSTRPSANGVGRANLARWPPSEGPPSTGGRPPGSVATPRGPRRR